MIVLLEIVIVNSKIIYKINAYMYSKRKLNKPMGVFLNNLSEIACGNCNKRRKKQGFCRKSKKK